MQGHGLEKITNKIDVLNIPVSASGIGSVPSLFCKKMPNRSLVTTFVNPHACYLEKHHADYAEMLGAFDVVTCDGIGMVKAAWASGCEGLEREAFDFTSIAGDVLQEAAKRGWSVGLVGGKPGVTKSAAKVFEDMYPELKITGCFSGYGAGPKEAIEFFTQKETQLVICGMGAPLQEKFLVDLVSNGWCGMGFTCGGFLDQTINRSYSYPKWIDENNLRFLYRLLKEPRRLWRRYLVEYQVFVFRFVRLKLKLFRS